MVKIVIDVTPAEKLAYRKKIAELGVTQRESLLDKYGIVGETRIRGRPSGLDEARTALDKMREEYSLFEEDAVKEANKKYLEESTAKDDLANMFKNSQKKRLSR